MSNEMLLRADPAILRLHAETQEYASAVNRFIALAHGGVSPHPLSGAALYALTADLFGAHRAVLSLCEDGWAFAAVPLLRTMLELLMSAAVITERESEAEYRGFKYTHFFLKAQLNDADLSTEVRIAVCAQIEKGIGQLPVGHQQTARDFMFRAPLRGYWYYPEYQRPTEVLDNLFSPEIRFLYNTYSGGSHGGYLGLKLLKDQPDQVHPNPRADPRSQNRALVGSTRVLLEAMNLRDHFENGGANQREYRELLGHLAALRPAEQEFAGDGG